MRRGAAALVLLALAAARLAALDDVELAAHAPWSDPEGYTPVVVTVTARRDADVDIVGEVGRTSARLALHLAAGETARRTLLMPPTGNGGGITVRWRAGELTGETLASVGFDADLTDVVALDPRETLPLADLARALESRVGVRTRRWSSRSVAGYPATRLQRLPAEQLPDRWQGWPAWLTLFTTVEGETALDDEQRRAIADWTRAGGAVFVAEERQAAAWRALGVEPVVLGLTRAGGAIDAAAPGPAALIARLQRIMEDRNFSAPRHRVPGTERVAVGGFTLVAGLFALLVGPLNLWWVRRRDARHLFLVTTPLLSLATCAGLVGFDLVAEGLSLRRAARQYAVLDQRTQRLACWTGATYFAGFAVGSLALDADAKALPFNPEDDDWRTYHRRTMRDAEAYALDWRDGQRASGAWIPARVNRHLAIAEMRPERRRLIVARAGSAWQATNGFDATLDNLRWRDRDGRWWGCESLAAGASAVLTPSSDPGLPRDVPCYGRTSGVRPPATDEVLRNDAGPTAHAAWLAAATRPCIARASLAGPLVPPPGPAADDAEPITTHLIAIVDPD